MKYRLSTSHGFNEMEIAVLIIMAMFFGARLGLSLLSWMGVI